MKIKSLLTTLVVGTSLFGGSLFANSVVVSTDDASFNWDHDAGELKAKTSDNGTFQTFCLENKVFISVNSNTPYTYTIDSGVLSVAQPLSQGTAWLYGAFLDGLLPNNLGSGNYADNLLIDADLLQFAIWALQGQVPAQPTNVYYNLGLTLGGTTLDGGLADYTGYEIKVLNPWGPNGEDVQSLLIRSVPDGGTTSALLGLGLLGLALVRRKK